MSGAESRGVLRRQSGGATPGGAVSGQRAPQWRVVSVPRSGDVLSGLRHRAPGTRPPAGTQETEPSVHGPVGLAQRTARQDGQRADELPPVLRTRPEEGRGSERKALEF